MVPNATFCIHICGCVYFQVNFKVNYDVHSYDYSIDGLHEIFTKRFVTVFQNKEKMPWIFKKTIKVVKEDFL